MIKSRFEIELKRGESVEMLFTLALYGIAKRRGISLNLPAEAGADERITYFIKRMYCAAILAWEYEAIDNPKLGEFPYKFMDFAEWSGNNPVQFASIIKKASSALAGEDFGEEDKDPNTEDVKKKI